MILMMLIDDEVANIHCSLIIPGIMDVFSPPFLDCLFFPFVSPELQERD